MDAFGLNVFIVISRLEHTGRSTPGLVSVSSTVVGDTYNAYTLERLPYGVNPRMPAGTYSAYQRYQSVDGVTRYDPPRIHLVGVSGYPGGQIHVGNRPGETTGCALAGTREGIDAVWDSETAMRAINSIIDADATGNITVIIHNYDNTPGE